LTYSPIKSLAISFIREENGTPEGGETRVPKLKLGCDRGGPTVMERASIGPRTKRSQVAGSSTRTGRP